MNVDKATEHGRKKVSLNQASFEALKGIGSLTGKGLNLGIVLFLALSTLSILNRGLDSLEASLRNLLTSERAVSRNGVVIPRPAQASISPYTSRPAVREGGSVKTIRETTYFLNELEHFTRSLSRFGR